jgi:hypothetical protein
MSRENVEVLRRLNEAFNCRDVDAAIRFTDRAEALRAAGLAE